MFSTDKFMGALLCDSPTPPVELKLPSKVLHNIVRHRAVDFLVGLYCIWINQRHTNQAGPRSVGEMKSHTHTHTGCRSQWGCGVPSTACAEILTDFMKAIMSTAKRQWLHTEFDAKLLVGW